ncbi:Hypothetical protein, putative [Bodo saltans]|uniref:Uncharacterized protein n=1 Tax=Bodo saltans TaxID=75058 RepID=A0A0S4KNY0_BODSA|nr:Hypothetical protein, putative [Bodo saltans]|eukprot:CUI15255.1 Hypothetical protein, putative [Bodo saltans]
MIRFRRLTQAAPSFNVDALGLSEQLQEEIDAFDANAASAGLPWIDKLMYRGELLDGASVSALSRITKLNRLLQRQAELATSILVHVRQREGLINKLLMTCAFDHAHEECSHNAHRQSCEILRVVDDETDEIIRLIALWRKGLALPLPFMVDGENYLLRMGTQIALGKGLAHVGGHLRNTCRHLQYFYASSFDPVVVETNKVLQRQELFVLRDELESQTKLCEESLRLARMGMYMPVLKFRHRGPAASGPTMVMLDNKRWKTQLILSFSNGLMALSRTRPVQDSGMTSAMMQFAGMASKVLHKRYFLVWLQFRRRRIERRRAIHGMALMAEMMVQQRYLTYWRRRLDRSHMLKGKCEGLLMQSNAMIMRRYMQKLFIKSAMKRAERLVKRAMSGRYYRLLHFRAVRNMLQGHRKAAALAQPGAIEHHTLASAVAPWLEATRIAGSVSLLHLQALTVVAARAAGDREPELDS